MREADFFPWIRALCASSLWLMQCALVAQVSWSVDTTQIQWGEPLTLTAEWLLTVDELSSGEADSSAWPVWRDTTNSGFEILDESPIDTLAAPLNSQADILLRKTWQLTSWDSGFVVMAPEKFGRFETRPLLVRVITPDLPEDALPMPAADIREVKRSLWEALLQSWPWILIVVAAIGLFWFVRWLRQRWLNRTNSPEGLTQTETPEEDPHVRALRVLQRLKTEKGWTHGRAKEVQAEASLAIRYFLEGQYGIPAAERTTQDIQALLLASAIPKPWQARLVNALEQADSVKFAKVELPELSHVALLDAYIEFVSESQPLKDEEA